MNKMEFPDAQGSTALRPDAQPSSPEALAPYVDNGTERFSTDRYTSPDWAKTEWERMW